MSENTDYYSRLAAITDAHHEIGQVLYLESAPGTGKTSFVYSLTERGTVNFMGEELPIVDTIKLALNTMDTGDLLGIPTKEYMDWVKNGVETQIPVTEYATPEWAVRAAKGAAEGVVYVILDEWSRADLDVVGAMLNVLEHGVMPNGFTFGPRVLFVLMGNGRQHDRGVYELTPALTSRVTKLDFSPDLVSWLEGLVTNFGKPGELTEAQLSSRALIAAFLKRNPESAVEASASTDRTKPWANYRTWTHFADIRPGIISRAEKIGPEADGFQRMIATGIVGETAANEFMDFIEDVQVPAPDELITDPSLLDNLPTYIAHVALLNLATVSTTREATAAAKIVEGIGTDNAREARKARHARTSGPLLDLVKVLNYATVEHKDIVIGLVTSTSRDLVMAHGRGVVTGDSSRVPEGVPVLNREHLRSVLDSLTSATDLLDDAA